MLSLSLHYLYPGTSIIDEEGSINKNLLFYFIHLVFGLCGRAPRNQLSQDIILINTLAAFYFLFLYLI